MYNAFFLLIGFQFIARNIQFNSATKSNTDIKVCSFNTNVQRVYSEGNTSKEINTFLSTNKYDVAVLIEWLDKKGRIDKDEFPHQQFIRLNAKRNKYNYGLRFVSKHPIINYERIKYTHFTNNMAAFFDVEIDGEIIRFFTVHLHSNSVSSKDYHTLVNVDLGDEYTDYALNFAKRLKKQIQRRSEQTKTVADAINESPYPVIIMGDFNDTPQSYAYQQLKEGRKDAFIERGSGWGATFLKPFPILRIDYILHDNELECTSYNCISDIKSDHALVEATFRLNK
ncbi:MAG: hypothetical protein COA58_10350 [Bacteroidetes bacterium]|nr:MAG: hypothetical protein COA58_10350 [Bacteroidota bacterium]